MSVAGDGAASSRMREATERRPDSGELLSALQRIGVLVNQPMELTAALTESLALLCEAGGFAAGHALLLQAERLVSAGVFVGGDAQLREACSRATFGPGDGPPGRVLLRRATEVSDLKTDPRSAAAAAIGIRSAAVCPILVGGEVAAAIELFSTAESPDARALPVLEAAAALLGRVIERSSGTKSLPPGEDVFRTLCEALPVGLMLTDASGKPVYVNPAFENVVGRGLAQVLDGGWREFVHPDDQRQAADRWYEAVAKKQPLRTEARILRDGVERVLDSIYSPILRPDGSLAGYVGVVEDSTPQHEAREALRESEDRLRAFFENAGVGLVLASEEGKVVKANRAYGRFLERRPEDLVGTDVLHFIHPDDHDHLLRMRQQLRAGHIDRYETERRYLRPDGTAVWGLATVTRSKESRTLVGVVQDIDARKRAEEAVRKLSGRFLRLQDEERRRIARELHESAAQTVAALAMNLHRLERMPLPPMAREGLADSLGLVGQASREIRTLSHLLHPPLLDEAGLPSSVRWFVQGFAARSNVKVNLELDDELGRLPTEVEIALFRIVQESLTNVHRHSGSQSANIRLHRVGPDISLEVADRGLGMTPEVLQRVSEQGSGGVGVGIAGMRERLAQLGGTLEIESSRGGTMVRARIRSEP